MYPNPAVNFTEQGYSGLWYEIAKYQTAGGAFFEKDCVCTQLDVFTDPTTDDYMVTNTSRQKTPDGKQSSAVAELIPSGPNGHFNESFSPYAPAVNYTIVGLGEYEGEEYSVEYDCGSNLTGTNYCIHIMARKPTMSDELLQLILAEVDAAGLNAFDLPLQMTMQQGCYDNVLQ